MFANSIPASAADVLGLYWNNSMPVNPISIANAMGLRVYKNSSMENEGEFLFHDNIPTIVFKPSGRLERDRFTIAHELGHYCLGHGPRHRDTPTTLYHAPHEPLERAANKFAAELLMPPKIVEFAVRVSPLDTVKKIADYFQVSEIAMRIRLKELGYL